MFDWIDSLTGLEALGFTISASFFMIFVVFFIFALIRYLNE